jgi:large subunit ribosomal protein L24e
MRVDRCDFSGFKVYPSRGKVYVRGDSKTFRFAGSKSESLFLQRKNPRKIAWTQVYRRMHKKGITEEVAKKRSRKNVKVQRGVVGADLASILAKRTAKPEVRQAARQAAITKAKAAKKEKETKKAARPQGAGAPKVSKQAAKGTKGGR